MRAVIYCRTAATEKALLPEQDHGIRNQERACQAHCKAAGYRIIDAIIDSGVSGVQLERPALDLWLASRVDADVIVMASHLRLARDRSIADEIISRLQRRGGGEVVAP